MRRHHFDDQVAILRLVTADDLDPRAILAALGVADATELVPVAGGWDTRLWRVERGGRRFGLGVFRAEQAEICRREVVAMRAAAAGGVPVPGIEAEGGWQGRPALLLTWCRGRPLLDALVASPWRISRLGREFGRLQ